MTHRRAVLILLGCTFVWGASFTLNKMVLDEASPLLFDVPMAPGNPAVPRDQMPRIEPIRPPPSSPAPPTTPER